MNEIHVKLTLVLYYKDGTIKTTHGDSKTRIIGRAARQGWKEAHVIATYQTELGRRVASNRAVCTTWEEVVKAMETFTGKEYLDNLKAGN